MYSFQIGTGSKKSKTESIINPLESKKDFKIITIKSKKNRKHKIKQKNANTPIAMKKKREFNLLRDTSKT